MSSFFSKTFGGLNLQYYLRHFLFGLIFYGSMVFVVWDALHHKDLGGTLGMIAVFTLFQCLYPYSRFVYESVVNYIMGDNVFFTNTIVFLTTKFITMFLCWAFSWAIAPIGFIYLYFYYTKQEKQASQENQNP